ncbi:GMP synthase (glutamine-hydrolysing) [Hasllibacter halocynthiae]|uniref:GMP synthase (Glutamine-hydrolysing) n=1 Tax=Hasllibacter halocynthiae TaxID=595589 RepID=A0A2T0X6X0_9RHOB|nr:type 1 glutamine amidotransferase [Hasllibacter halocynthiae]PRY94679.1 GMP synthase (glutamine-hydrolysing) [Hasllibacter halocynthiae]
MLIGILLCGHTTGAALERLGEYDAAFRDLLGGPGREFRTWSVVDMEFPEGPREADAWVVTGSKHGAYEDLPFIPRLEDFIRAVHEANVPTVGICFGHQIVAQALGGRVEKFPEGWAVGRTEYEIEGLGRLHLNAWHQDQVTVIPPGARVVGQSGHCATAALSYGPHLWTIQPHPEFTNERIALMVPERKGTLDYEDDRMDAALEGTSLPTDGDRIAEKLLEVLESVREVQDA